MATSTTSWPRARSSSRRSSRSSCRASRNGLAGNAISDVMAGQKRGARLRTNVPAIRACPSGTKYVDARDKPGHDERSKLAAPNMTETLEASRPTPTVVPAPPLLAVRNIEVVYDDVILVLRGLSLDVPKGAIV